MDISIVWKSLILILAGAILLKISGRKSIAQMTITQTIVMISIGTIIVQPIVEKGMMKAIAGAAIFVLTMLVFEYLQLKFNLVEKLVTGKPKIVIENGKLNIQNLKKLRLTVDQLEMRMREKGISKLADVKTATIEANGLLGYELKDDVKPLTAGEFRKMLKQYNLSLQADIQNQAVQPIKPADGDNIFAEVKNPQDGMHPDYLQ